MSNFVTRAIRTMAGREVLPKWHPRLSARVVEQQPPTAEAHPFHREYLIEIRAGACVTCAPADSERAVEQLRKRLHHEVYGDLIAMLVDLRMAVYEQDSELAVATIQKMEDYIRD